MTSSVWRAFRDEAVFAIDKPAYTFQTQPITTSAWSQYVPLVPRAGMPYVLGVVVEAQCTLTPSTAAASVTVITVGPANTSTDVLDESIDQVQVSPAPNTQPRSYSTSRLYLEEVERILLDVRGLAYPRASLVSFTATTTARTDTGTIFIPVGGGAGSVRLHVPSVTATFASNVTSSVVYNCYVISGDNSSIPTFLEAVTGSLASAQQDISTWYPANLSPMVMSFVNETTTTLTRLYQTAQSGDIMVDMQDSTIFTYAQNMLASNTTYSYNMENVYQEGARFKTLQATFGTAGARDFGFLELLGSTTSNPATKPASTPATPAAQSPGTGSQGAGNLPAPIMGGQIGVNTGARGSRTFQRKGPNA